MPESCPIWRRHGESGLGTSDARKPPRRNSRVQREEVDHSDHIDVDGEPCDMGPTWKNRLARDIAAILNDDTETDRG